ncbi:hypothetical protein Acj9p028 [Acinetobacter phage Acj9]|uniref:Uncharacterized protein n=1 Tax=Acinetobacter phage Acj9 TaxID=760939 RepID=E5EPG2_9CAUD|nr:hypothetical protein Acj9p028 [Acinetobacter phage Acj9]ADG59928.1 hypothetical protein Acj9p028 [Acinetobacter phage Acj9]
MVLSNLITDLKYEGNIMTTIIQLPKADYIVIDPCYVMRSDAYDQLCEKMDFDANAQLIEIDGHQMALSGTAYGDGSYQSTSNTVFPVDAGIIGAVPLALCDLNKLDEQWVIYAGVRFNDTEISFEYDNGTFKFNDLQIFTNYEEEEDDLEDEY